MKLNEVDQDFGQKIQGLDQAMRKTDNKCKDLEDKIAKVLKLILKIKYNQVLILCLLLGMENYK